MSEKTSERCERCDEPACDVRAANAAYRAVNWYTDQSEREEVVARLQSAIEACLARPAVDWRARALAAESSQRGRVEVDEGELAAAIARAFYRFDGYRMGLGRGGHVEGTPLDESVAFALAARDLLADLAARPARPLMPDQRALLDQIADVRRMAVDAGMYDADDFIGQMLPARPSSPAPAPGEPTGATCAFRVGDRVRKVGGDYSIDGTVRAVFAKESGAVRLVVEADVPAGLLHIYSEKNLERIGEPTGAGLTVAEALRDERLPVLPHRFYLQFTSRGRRRTLRVLPDGVVHVHNLHELGGWMRWSPEVDDLYAAASIVPASEVEE